MAAPTATVLVSCTTMTIVRRENLSAATPPTSAKTNSPMLRHATTDDSATGLSSIANTWKTSTIVHIPMPKIDRATLPMSRR